MLPRRRLALLMALIVLAAPAVNIPSHEPAQADPPPNELSAPLTGVGGANTERVMDALADSITLDGRKVLASYDSTGSAEISTVDPRTGRTCWLARPATEEAGFERLLGSARVGDNCVTFARMSTPYHDGATTDPGMVYAPYALDGVTYLVRRASSVPRQLTSAQLQQVYRCEVPEVQPLLPGKGSGVRAVWLKFVGITEADLDAGRYPCISTTSGGEPIVENRGYALVADNQVLPHSIANYLAQLGGTIPPRLGMATPGTVTDVPGQAPVVANLRDYPEDVTFVVREIASVPRRISPSELRALYTCQEVGVKPLLPAAGRVREAFLAMLEIPESEIEEGRYPCVTTLTTGENDARVLTEDNMILPFGVAAYVSQMLGTAADLRVGKVPGVLQPAGPTASLPIALNTSYLQQLVFHTYNALPVDVHPDNRSLVNAVFHGPNALICQQDRVLETYGLAPIPADDPQPCGSGQYETSFDPGASRITSLTALTALDTGRLAGSGAMATVRHGRCTLQGSYSNANDGSRTTITAKVSGPNCKVNINAQFFDHNDGRTLTQGKQQDVSGAANVVFTHTPGARPYHLNGVSQFIGQALQFVWFELRDAAYAGYSRTTVRGAYAPTFRGPTIVTGNKNRTLSWDKVDTATAYRIKRRNVTLGQEWSQVATVAPDPQALWSEQWHDPDVAYLYQYEYRIEAVNASGVFGNSTAVRSTAAAPLRIKHYVVMGDSYAAGEGGYDYYDSTCHRSRFGYGPNFRDPADPTSMIGMVGQGQARLDILACSGAVTGNVIPGLSGSRPQPRMEAWISQANGRDPAEGRRIAPDYQIAMLRAANRHMPVDLVTLSIGGNDAGFTDVLKHCALHECDNIVYENARRAVITGLRSRLADTYRAVLDNSGDAHVKVVGYPRLFPNDGGWTDCGMTSVPSMFTEVTPGEMRMLNRLGDELNQVIAETVAQVNAAEGRIAYIDPRPWFTGHDMCTFNQAWLHKIKILNYRDSAHPNATGYGEMANRIPRTFLGIG